MKSKSLVDYVADYGLRRYYDAEAGKCSLKRVLAYLRLRKFMLFTGMYIQPSLPETCIVTDKQHTMMICWRHR